MTAKAHSARKDVIYDIDREKRSIGATCGRNDDSSKEKKNERLGLKWDTNITS